MPAPASEHFSTIEVARQLGMAVRSVQMMVDRGLLQAWRTPGGHRRIARASVEQWLAERHARPDKPRRPGGAELPAGAAHRGRALQGGAGPAFGRPLRLLLIEDSGHFQTLVGMLVGKHLPRAELHMADDGIAGLAMAGKLEPDILLVDIALPGIDGATLITSLRSHPQFSHSQLVVVTGLDDQALAPYMFALTGVPLIRKTRLVQDLPALLARLASAPPRPSARAAEWTPGTAPDGVPVA